MQRGTILIVFQVLLCLSCASKQFNPEWPATGFVVYVSKELTPDFSQQAAGQPPVDWDPTVTGSGSNLPTQALPACEPVEVRAVHRTSLRVRWLQESRNSSTLGEDWSSVVHRSREECLEHLKTPGPA